jgi:hypothetical protein
MATWSEAAGRVSQAFGDWYWVEVDQRAFLALGLRFAEAAYERIWEKAGNEPADPDGPEQIDIFEERVDGLHEPNYRWMHCCAVFRDAVTNFEVYLEKAREEVLGAQGQAVEVGGRSPWWRELSEFFEGIEASIETEEIEEVRRLRDFLVHRRGELRTPEQRAEFAREADVLGAISVEVTEEGVIAAMDLLGETVRRIDASVYRYSWGREALPS